MVTAKNRTNDHEVRDDCSLCCKSLSLTILLYTHLWDEEQYDSFAAPSQYSYHCKCHACKITESVPNKHCRGIPEGEREGERERDGEREERERGEREGEREGERNAMIHITNNYTPRNRGFCCGNSSVEGVFAKWWCCNHYNLSNQRIPQVWLILPLRKKIFV